MESVKLSTKVDSSEISKGVKDEFGVIYSADGLKLLECPSNIEISDYVIKQGTKVIADLAFNCCKKISEIVLPKGVEGIGESAFECCDKLSKIVIPERVKEIENGVFRHCRSLSKIVIPEG